MVQGADPREGATWVTALFLFIFCSSHLPKGHESKELDIALNDRLGITFSSSLSYCQPGTQFVSPTHFPGVGPWYRSLLQPHDP